MTTELVSLIMDKKYKLFITLRTMPSDKPGHVRLLTTLDLTKGKFYWSPEDENHFIDMLTDLPTDAYMTMNCNIFFMEFFYICEACRLFLELLTLSNNEDRARRVTTLPDQQAANLNRCPKDHPIVQMIWYWGGLELT